MQKSLPLIYKNVTVPCAFRVDLVVNGCVVVESKCVSEFLAIHQAQLLTYLKLTGCPVGLLMNFQVPVLKQGLRASPCLRASVVDAFVGGRVRGPGASGKCALGAALVDSDGDAAYTFGSTTLPGRPLKSRAQHVTPPAFSNKADAQDNPIHRNPSRQRQ